MADPRAGPQASTSQLPASSSIAPAPISIPSSSASQLSSDEKRLFEVFRGYKVGDLDWDAFKGTYKGRALITRLNHIATLLRLPSPTTPPVPFLQILKKASQDAIGAITTHTLDKEAYDRHLVVLDIIDMHLKETGAIDNGDSTGELGNGQSRYAVAGWFETAEAELRKEGTRLDVELKGYMSNLIKESIRLTYLALAELSLRAGSWSGALKNYGQAREYSSSPQHHLDVALGNLETCLAYNITHILPGHIAKVEGALNRLYPVPENGKQAAKPGAAEMASMTAGEVRDDRQRAAHGTEMRRVINIKIQVAQGLVALSKGSYVEAGRLMGRVLEEGGLGEWEGVVMSTADVCLIVGLCVLATGKRDVINDVLIDRTSFRTSLDDSQGWMLDLIRAYMSAQYGEAEAIYERAEPELMLNIWISAHARNLRRKIMERSIVQYIEPFSTVRISTMASAFGLSEGEMMEQVEGLIWAGNVKGRIDLVDRILTVKMPDARASLINNALKTGNEAVASSQAALLRMRLHEAGISVDPSRGTGDGDEEMSTGEGGNGTKDAGGRGKRGLEGQGVYKKGFNVGRGGVGGVGEMPGTGQKLGDATGGDYTPGLFEKFMTGLKGSTPTSTLSSESTSTPEPAT